MTSGRFAGVQALIIAHPSSLILESLIPNHESRIPNHESRIITTHESAAHPLARPPLRSSEIDDSGFVIRDSG
jgi:hypothetical protein